MNGRWPGHFPDEDIPLLFAAAEGLIRASGRDSTAILEAMTCGAPVPTSAVASHPEVLRRASPCPKTGVWRGDRPWPKAERGRGHAPEACPCFSLPGPAA